MKPSIVIVMVSLLLFSMTIISSVFAGEKTPQEFSGLRFGKYTTVAEKTEKAEIKEKKETKKDKLLERKPEEIKILKEAAIERIGAAAAYEEFAGLRFGKYFTVGQRLEFFQEAKPIDTYILDAKAMRILGQGALPLEWNTDAHYRSQIVPQFTRAYGTQITMDNPDDPGGQIRFILDYRDIYKQYYPKYTGFKPERWLQPEILLIYSGKIPGIGWYFTSNLGYRYSNIEPKSDRPGYENRHTYTASMSLAPNARFEWFGQFQYYKSMRVRSSYHYRPDHWYYKTELRIKSADLSTSVIPSFSYSVDYYWPFTTRYEKYEIACRIGRDFTNRFSGTTQIKYVLGLREESDNTAPSYAAPNPYEDMAAWIGTENRVSYRIWNDFYLQGGIDFAAGTNMSDFDNWGTFAGIEYYKPGVLRANFGWNTNFYYNINDSLNTIGFKIFILM